MVEGGDEVGAFTIAESCARMGAGVTPSPDTRRVFGSGVSCSPWVFSILFRFESPWIALSRLDVVKPSRFDTVTKLWSTPFSRPPMMYLTS